MLSLSKHLYRATQFNRLDYYCGRDASTALSMTVRFLLSSANAVSSYLHRCAVISSQTLPLPDA